MNHNFDYENADRKDLLERCKRFEVAVDAQHALCMEAFKERDTYRELCAELLEALKKLNENEGEFNEDLHMYCDWKKSRDDADLAITKAEAILGGNNGTSN